MTLVNKIYITLDDRRVYSIPAHVVAHHRAQHYAAKDKDTTYQEEYDHALEDNFELTDWLFNNMDWYELTPTLEQTPEPLALNEALVVDVEVREG